MYIGNQYFLNPNERKRKEKIFLELFFPIFFSFFNHSDNISVRTKFVIRISSPERSDILELFTFCKFPYPIHNINEAKLPYLIII